MLNLIKAQRRIVRLPLYGLALVTLLLAGCTTSLHYQPATAGGTTLAAWPTNYPVPLFTEDATVPRPAKIIGTVSTSNTGFSTIGGDIQVELKKLLKLAREQGADAVQLTTLQKPDYSDTNYRFKANLLSYTDTWETVSLSTVQFEAYLAANQGNLDPIEGVWNGRGAVPQYIGIMRDPAGKGGRDFVGFILGTQNPSWKKGYRKMDIQHGAQPNTYFIEYYLDDFTKRTIPIDLGPDFKMTLTLKKSVDDDAGVRDIVTYVKNW
jgi:hypothetical protein